MTPTTYGRDFAYCLKSHGGVRGFNASLWRFLLRCTLFCHSVATFLTSVSSYEGGCGFEVHFFWNWIQGPVLGYEVSGNRFCEILFSLRLPANNLINGGAFGFEGSLVCTVLATLFTLFIIWWFEQ